MNVELPEGWVESTVSVCFSEMRNGTTATQNTLGEGLPVSRIETIQNSRFDLSRIRHIENLSAVEIETFRYRSGDIAFSHINSYEHVGKTALYQGEPELLIHGMNLLRLRPGNEVIEPRFAHLFMQTDRFREEVRRRVGHAVNQVSINQGNLGAVPFLLAPPAEQRRIVAKLEALVAKINASRGRLDKIPTILKRFRQAVLAAACNGRLTADWRTEPEASGVEGLPPDWRADTVAGVCDAVVDCPHSTPKWESVGYVCVRTTQLRAGRLDLSSPFYVSVETYKERTKRLKPRAGDILYCREGVVGAACIVPSGVDLCLGQRLMLMRASKKIAPAFLMHALNSELTLAQARDRTLGTTAQHVNVGDVKRFALLLPPLAEQDEIVRRVESMFALAERLQARYEKAKAQVDRLTQSVLAKAFRGGLVTSEADLARREGREYETAEELLERVRTERVGAPVRQPRGLSKKRVARVRASCT